MEYYSDVVVCTEEVFVFCADISITYERRVIRYSYGVVHSVETPLNFNPLMC